MDAHGRTFQEYERVRVVARTVTGIASNRVWLYSADQLEDVESGDVYLQLVRWRALHDKEHRPIWANWRRYNIRSAEQWDSASVAVEAFLGRESIRKDPTFEEEYSPVEEGVTAVAASTKRKAKQAGDEDELARLQLELRQTRAAKDVEVSSRRRADARLRQMSRHTRTYQRSLKEFRTLIQDSATNETAVHRFILKHNPFWLFGLEYLGVEGPVPFPPNSRSNRFYFDLMLHRMDGFYDLVELKGPNESLFDRRTKRRGKLNAKLAEAISQVLVYLEACDRFGKGRLFKPKAMIVIGSKRTDDPRQRRLLASHLAHVEVLTYSGLVERGTQLLKHLEGWKS